MSRILLRVTLALAVPAGMIATSAPAVAAAGRPLTFESRVACRSALEEVYWRSRIWPASNPDPKPALAEIASSADIAAMVEESLAQSAALEEYWQEPITVQHERCVRRVRDSPFASHHRLEDPDPCPTVDC